MIFGRTGRVRDQVHVLGTAAVPVYLLDGPEPVLFDGGVTCLCQPVSLASAVLYQAHQDDITEGGAQAFRRLSKRTAFEFQPLLAGI